MLKEGEKLYISTKTLDELPFGAYVIDKEGFVLFFNKVLTKMSGAESSSVIVGTNVFENPNYKEYGLIDYIKKGLRGEPFVIDQLQYYSFNSNTKSLRRYKGIPLLNEQGQVSQLLCLVEDLSEKEKIQKELVKNKENYEAIFQNLIFMAFTFDLQGRFISLNQKAEKFLGKKEEELKGKNFSRIGVLFVKKEMFLAMKDFVRVATGEKETLTDVYRLKRHDGEIRLIEITSILMKREEKNKNVLCIGVDITESKRNEKRLQSERKQKETYLDIINILVIALNLKGEITMVSRFGAEVIGENKEDLIGKNWFENYLPEREKENAKKIFKQTIESKDEVVGCYENTILTKKGEERLITWHNTLVKDESGEIVGTLSSGEDVTEKKKAEEEIVKRNKDLEKFNKLMVGRELKMAEMKKKIREYEEKLKIMEDNKEVS